MIDLGTTHFCIRVPSVSRTEFERYSTQLFDEWEKDVSGILALPDYSLALEVEEGSVKGHGVIAVVLAALYLGIGNYGDFVSGLQTIRSQINSVGDFLAERAANPFVSSGYKATVRKHGGSLARLQRLFVKVQRQEMTVEQAMLEAEALLGDQVTTAPEFMQQLHMALRQTPRLPQQLSLFLDTPEELLAAPDSEEDRSPRPSRPMPIIPPPEKLRVEIRRESKKGKREVRVIQL
ncbi:MAG TPA: hypothetical protein DCZ95_19775 [Verrucomicrobia bacterium]|nr:MAG: hypothetical protein A2X46_11005 [Lentisphaerae bacterium GWF2_57_35]HBA86326.1 hypothetical protein [Verrucomicrobiota bacterium]